MLLDSRLSIFGRSLGIHLRTGVPAAVFVELVIGCLIFVDWCRYDSFELSRRLALAHTLSVASRSWAHALLELVTLGVAIPCLATIALQYLDISPTTKRYLGKHRKLLLLIHFCGMAAAGYGLILAKSMQEVSGYVYENGQVCFAFASIHDSAVVMIVRIGTTIGGVMVFLIGVVGSAVPNSRFGLWFEDYLSRSRFATSGGTYYPRYGSERLDFNAGALAPEIDYIQRLAERLNKRYQNMVPGSSMASQFVREAADKCRSMLHQLLFPYHNSGDVLMDFYPGTSRALEIALCSIVAPKGKVIVVSPFEHESVNSVVQWHCLVDKSSFCIQVSCSLDASWESQCDACKTAIKSAVATNSELTLVFIISEVCAANGKMLSVVDLVNRISQDLGTTKLFVIVDGAHAVSVLPGIFENGWDQRISYYVLSGHKWLLAPEPSGILVYRKDGTPEEGSSYTSPYDGLVDGKQMPSSTFSARAVLSLCASLQFLQKGRVRLFRKLGSDALKMFCESVKDKATIVGDQTNTWTTSASIACMVSIRPREGFHWERGRSKAALQKAFEDEKLHVQIIENEGRLWVRVSFAHFVDNWKLRRLRRVILREIVPNSI